MTTAPSSAALLFDLDDTLIPEAQPLASAYRAVARAVFGAGAGEERASQVRLAARALWEAQAPALEFCRRVHIGPSDALSSDFEGDAQELAQLREFLPHFRAHAFDGALPAGFDGGGVELREAWWATRMGTQTVFPGARELLASLRDSGRYRMAIVTNGTSDFQRHKIARMQLGDYFDAIIVSGDLGSGKPNPEPFLAALSALDASAADAVMIGNDAARDIAGARPLGIRTIWVQPHESPAPGTVTNLAEIPALLGA